RHGARAATLRERATAQELAASPLTNDHRCAAQMTFVLRHHRLGLLALDRPRVLAGLRMILAGEERSEEAAARLELAAAIRTARIRHRREVVGIGDEGGGIYFGQPQVERRPEVLEHFLPAEVSVFDLVELLLHLRGEVDVKDVGELLHHHLLDGLAELGGEEAALVELYVAAVGEHRDDRRVRRRPADAQPFEFFNEARFGEARRRLGEVLARRDTLARHLLTDVDDGQRLLVLERLGVAFFARFLIERQEALELHDRPGRPEEIAATADIRLRRGGDVEVDGGRIEDRRRHLARHEPLPHELIELELVGAQELLHGVRAARGIGRTNRLVRVLRILRLFAAAVQLRRLADEFLAEQRTQIVARLTGSAFGHARRVGPHVGDETHRALGAELDAFVQVLGDAHGALRAERQFLGALLLQRRGRERRRRILAAFAAFYFCNVKTLTPLEVVENALRF